MTSVESHLKKLLFLRDFVVDLAADRAGEGPPRHLLEGLETQSSRVTAEEGGRGAAASSPNIPFGQKPGRRGDNTLAGYPGS